MWQAIRENQRAVVYAVLMHLVLLALLMFSLDWTPKTSRTAGESRPIQAELIDQRRLEVVEERKREAEQAAKQKAEAEQKRKAEQAAKQKAEAEQKRKAELAATQKAEAEQKRKAELAAKQKAEAEQKRKAELAAKQKAEAEAALQASIAAEQALLEEQRVQSALGEYIGYIAEKVERNWLRPAGSPKGLRCKVNVKVIPGGDVASARVIESSGDPVFDRSAENAVLRAAPLPMPKDPAIARHFRDFNFNFEPL
ncbi:MAG: cell envelope integrity protein TolA [Gammaproteobacteria bacterium]|nr:cell envelope integrity protein TolA [Gammaproteobacteria bacterium]